MKQTFMLIWLKKKCARALRPPVLIAFCVPLLPQKLKWTEKCIKRFNVHPENVDLHPKEPCASLRDANWELGLMGVHFALGSVREEKMLQCPSWC